MESQAINLALLVSAILAKRPLILSELARVYPTPEQHRVENPKHDLLHRLKRLWRFLNNDRVDDIAVQTALIPHTIARPGNTRRLAINWTMFDEEPWYPASSLGNAGSAIAWYQQRGWIEQSFKGSKAPSAWRQSRSAVRIGSPGCWSPRLLTIFIIQR